MKIDESFWIALCFLVFLVVIYRPIRKSLIGALDTKIDEIKKSLAEAEILNSEAQTLLAEIENSMESFEDTKKNMLDTVNNNSKILIETKKLEFDASLARTKDAALKSMTAELAKMQSELQQDFTESVIEVVKNYLITSNNNNCSETEIISHLLNESKKIDV